MPSPSILLVADDLTGAADSAVAFACHGHRSRILLESKAMPVDVEGLIAINIDSRDVREEELAERNTIVREGLQHSTICFRKIDSMLRGNTICEIALLARMELGVPIVLAPAHPHLGRRIVNGDLYWSDVHQQGGIALRSALQQRGIRCVMIGAKELASQLGEPMSAEPTVLLCDAGEQSDLEATVEAVLSQQQKVLWCGSGGLAAALAQRVAGNVVLTKSASTKGKRALFFIGSDHAVTRQQVSVLRQEMSAHAQIFEIQREGTTMEEIAAWVEDIDRKDVGCLVITGGDTATLVCRALGAQQLEVIAEFEHGVPRTRITGGIFDGVDALLKSGGFGTAGLFRRIADEYGEL